VLLAISSASAAPWHHPLYLSNGGYWSQRMVVIIENHSDVAVAGETVAVPVGALAGQRAESLRVCNEAGVELLFDAKRTGVLASDDVVFVPAEVGTKSSATVYVYAGNDAAVPVPDFLAAGFVNGDFENGTTGWKAIETDSQHIATYEKSGGRNGSAGVKVEVAPGAEPTWVKWNQTGIPVAPGRSYRFTGWVRAENVVGIAGWFLHVNGDKPMLLNPMLNAGSGSFGWKKVTCTFTAPATANNVTIGTVLRGTGCAWYDDAEFVETGDNPALRVMPGEVELLTFRAARAGDGMVVRVLNPDDKPTGEVMVHVDARRVRSLFPVSALPARSVSEIPIASEYDHERLVNSPLNLAPHAGTNGWTRFGATTRFGEYSLEFTLPAEAKPNWTGWRSEPIPVEPNATYLYSGFLKAEGVSGTVALHAHVHDANGKTMFVSTHPQVGSDSGWVKSSTFIQTPGDGTSVTLHLTMNTHGTLRHKGIVFCRVLPGEIVKAKTGRPSQGLQVWEVNPLVKVFPDDAPGKPARSVSVECASNEYEPFELALRSATTLKNVQVSVSELTNGKAKLPPVKVDRIGFVPIDHPSGYYHSEAKDWERRLPRGHGATDGWAGEWPDPLIPNAPFDLVANRAQPVWFTVRVPAEATPGEYRGEVMIRGFAESGSRLSAATKGGRGAEAPPTLLRFPVRVTVLPFALPKSTRLKTIFDFRFHGKTEERRVWLRFMAEHRLGISHIDPSPVFTYKDGKVTMDAAAFDEDARFCLDELGMPVAYTPWFFYMFGWAYPPKKIFGLEPFTAEYNDAFQQAYRLFSDHVKQRGWHDKFVYYISDEPHFHNQEFVVEQMKKLCALIHEVDAKIPIYSSTWRHCRDWDDSLDLWGVGQYGCFPVAEMERQRQRGKHFWFTCDGQMATDTPYLATERMLPYYCFKYGATGFEFWGINWYTYDPWERGWHKFIRQSDDGKRHYWIRYPNGDGYLAYPGTNGPVSTIRLEQVREGLEDYEALAMLSELAKKAGKRNGAGERALAMARDLVTIPNAGGLRSTEILPDPDKIPKIRKAVNAAIANMLKY